MCINVLIKCTWLVPPGRKRDCTLLRKIPHVDQKYTGENRRGTELVVTTLITKNPIFLVQNFRGFTKIFPVFSTISQFSYVWKWLFCPKKFAAEKGTFPHFYGKYHFFTPNKLLPNFLRWFFAAPPILSIPHKAAVGSQRVPGLGARPLRSDELPLHPHIPFAMCAGV